MPRNILLKRARQWKGLTQLALAEAVGIKEMDVTRLETGRAQPTPSIALRIARILDVDVSKIFPELGIMTSKEVTDGKTT